MAIVAVVVLEEEAEVECELILVPTLVADVAGVVDADDDVIVVVVVAALVVLVAVPVVAAPVCFEFANFAVAEK